LHAVEDHLIVDSRCLREHHSYAFFCLLHPLLVHVNQPHMRTHPSTSFSSPTAFLAHHLIAHVSKAVCQLFVPCSPSLT